MKVLVLLAFTLIGVLGEREVYYGLRVAKSCTSILKDNLELGKDFKFTDVKIPDISEKLGVTWNSINFTLSNIKIKDVKFDSAGFNQTTCNVIDTGIIKAFGYNEGVLVDITFDWKYSATFGSSSGTGSFQFKSELVEFLQNYHNSHPGTTVYVIWKVPTITLSGNPSAQIKSWCTSIVMKRLGQRVTLELNKKLAGLDEQIIASLASLEMTMADDSKVSVLNRVYMPGKGVHKDKDFVGINLKTAFKTDKHYYEIVSPLDAKLDNPEEEFDYKVCYGANFLGGFIHFRSLINDPFLNHIKLEDYPSHVSFYKSILPEIGNRFADDMEVILNFKGDSSKEIKYGTDGTLRIPTLCEFAIKSTGAPFLTFKTEYEVKYKATVEEERITIELAETKIASFETVPHVDFQARFVAMELASGFYDAINGYKIPGKGGLHISTVRSASYKFSKPINTGSEICLLYTEA